jgi:hypothetical protein
LIIGWDSHTEKVSGKRAVYVKSYRLLVPNGRSAGVQRRLVTKRILMLCFGGRTSEVKLLLVAKCG